MGARDSGWIQLFSENAQEAYDNAVQAPRIAENPDVKLPVMVTMDGFIISHAMEVMEILEDEKVREFIGKYVPENPLLDVDNPVTLGPVDLQDWNFEHKRQQAEAMRNAKPVILDVASEYAKLTGRKYGLFEEYKLDDADIAIVVLGSTAGTAKVAVDQLRAKGVRAGMLKIRVFRPFPAEEIADALKHVKAVAVMDRSDSFNAVGGPVFVDVRSALYDVDNGPKIVNYIYGIGGRDVTSIMSRRPMPTSQRSPRPGR